ATQTARQLEVSRNCSVGTLGCRIEAADPDSERIRPNPVYPAAPTRSHRRWSDFRVDSQSGSIRTTNAAAGTRERQQTTSFEFGKLTIPTVAVCSRTQVTATVTVRVLDINDNTPEIRFPRQGEPDISSVLEGAASQPVLQVLAVDLDELKMGSCDSSWSGISNKELFDIDPDNGQDQAGLFAELLGPTGSQLAQQQQQHRMRRKTNGRRLGQTPASQKSLAPFLSSGGGVPSREKVSDSRRPTAATFDDTANYVTYGGSRMQRRGPSQTLDTAGGTCQTKSKQTPPPGLVGLPGGSAKPPRRAASYNDLDLAPAGLAALSTGRRLVSASSLSTADGQERLDRLTCSSSSRQQQQQKPPPHPLPWPCLPPVHPAQTACPESGSANLPHHQLPTAEQPRSIDSKHLAIATLKHQGKLYSIPKAS
uniref:Cadherin domain-containing protein n=1 Tax=Macrostomum lignano TaxID=282301 RepID=A0A1I8F7Q5_9PLAT